MRVHLAVTKTELWPKRSDRGQFHPSGEQMRSVRMTRQVQGGTLGFGILNRLKSAEMEAEIESGGPQS